MKLSSQRDDILICGITPYFLEKGNFWIEENLKNILEARKTQSFFEDNTFYLEKEREYNLSQFLRKLDEMGYEKVLEVLEPGEFSQKGGVVDVFPINLTNSVRLDFLGNKLENIEGLGTKIENEEKTKDNLKKKLKSQKIYSDIKGIKPGDYVVHLDHGIGRFSGIEEHSSPQKYYVLEYAQKDKLYIPLGLERKLSLYIGFTEPRISRLTSLTWQRTKKRIKEETEKLAKELLELYAKREISSRPPYFKDNEIDFRLASTFPFEETPDQLNALEDIQKDLEKTKPMDRIICGDVGFGKTELALRTMVKAVRSGYQAAMLCPTTILANQHFQNFKERIHDLPIKMELLSRLQNKKEQETAIKNLNEGKTDIVIGTHRILSKDIDFKNLGMLVIDDEQRFGVKQKEKLKMIRSSLDILSLSATPIPRTMYLALSSLKDISIIQIPPAGRMAVKTEIKPFSEKIITEAIKKEIGRKGQAYYLYNRVETIETAKKNLEKLMPSLKFAVIHGRMKEREMIETMNRFQARKINVLISTTIVENGIDLQNVNTLIVADASRLGLAQAYQLRGRVGRSRQQGFAFFLHKNKLNEKANLRLKALKEAEGLGSGYRIALKDLEIRGAGNILGKEQAGNVNKIGLNLYCQILSESIEKLKS